MKEWIIVACRAEAKIFERNNPQEDLKWLKTLTNKKGRRKEQEFNSDKPGLSYAKFSGACSPHKLEGKAHADEIARHFAGKISDFIRKAVKEKKLSKLTIFAGPHFLGILKSQMGKASNILEIDFIPKNIEKSQTEQIAKYLQ